MTLITLTMTLSRDNMTRHKRHISWNMTRQETHIMEHDKTRDILWNMTRQETLLWDMTSKDMHIKGDIIWKSEAVNSVHSGYGDKS